MGLFIQRPEENEEWTGLPSEPARPESAAERLPDAPSPGVGGIDLLFGGGSVVIPVTPVVEQSADRTDAEPDRDRETGAQD